MRMCKALLFLTIFSLICSSCFSARLELCKAEETLKDLSSGEVNCAKITKADITILGLYFFENNCDYFEPCYKKVILTSEKPTTIKLDASAKIENYVDEKNTLSRENRYSNSRFSFSTSFDFILNKPFQEKKHYDRLIYGWYSNAKTVFESRCYDYNLNYSEAKVKEFKKQKIGLSESEKESTRAGFYAVCGQDKKYNFFPKELKPFAQNLIFLNYSHFADGISDFSMKGELYVNGVKKEDLKTERIEYKIYAVVNSLTYEDGTIQTFNQIPINETEWLSEKKDTLPKIPWQGEGTENNPFLIKSAADLLALTDSEDFLSGNYYFKQVNDILDLNKSLNLESWGAYADNVMLAHYYDLTFSGHYDGNNKTISGLMIKNPSKIANTIPLPRIGERNFGLFRICRNAEIKNLTLCCDIDIKESSRAGALVGEANCATFTNIIVKGNVVSDGNSGGLVGFGNNITFNNISSCVNVNGELQAGGVLGGGNSVFFNDINIESSNIVGKGNTGGVAGYIGENSSVTNVRISANIDADHHNSGGVAGAFSSKCSVNGAIISGKISGSFSGGLCGVIEANRDKKEAPDRYENIISSADISANSAGGIVGKACNNVIICNCINKGKIEGKDLGGIISNLGEEVRSTNSDRFIPAIVERCVNHGIIENTKNPKTRVSAGGIAWKVDSTGLIRNCYSDGSVSGEWCGGISSDCSGFIKNCYSIGNLKTSSEGFGVGGIFQSGYNLSTVKRIDNCFITGDTKFTDSKNKNYTCEKLIGSEKIKHIENNQYFASVADIKLDSTWNTEIWEIVPGKYPELKGLPTDSNKKEVNNSPAIISQPIVDNSVIVTPQTNESVEEIPVIVPQMLELEP